MVALLGQRMGCSAVQGSALGAACVLGLLHDDVRVSVLHDTTRRACVCVESAEWRWCACWAVGVLGRAPVRSRTQNAVAHVCCGSSPLRDSGWQGCVDDVVKWFSLPP